MNAEPQQKTVEQLRREALDMQRNGYSIDVIAAVLRIDTDAARRLVGPGADCAD